MSQKYQYEKYHFEKLDGEPILLSTMYNTYEMSTDAKESVRATFDVLSKLDEPVYYILDWRNLNPLSMEDISVGAMSVALAENPLFKHPQILGLVFVTSSDILSLAARGLNSAVYGNIKIDVFATVDEALRYVRGKIG